MPKRATKQETELRVAHAAKLVSEDNTIQFPKPLEDQATNPPKQYIDFSKEIYQKTMSIQKNQEEFILCWSHQIKFH